MGTNQSTSVVKRQKKPVNVKNDLPWFQEKPPATTQSTSVVSGSQDSPELTLQAVQTTDMATGADDVFQDISYIFVVMGASVSAMVVAC